MKTSESLRHFQTAAKYIPGGVNTSLRSLDEPLVFAKAAGSRVFDVDGNEYIDYHAAFGPLILGHCNRKVNQQVFDTLERIDLIGTGTTELEARLAAKIVQHVPSAEMVLFCNSGSEATYHAVRLSRAVTGRTKVIKFQGCYHGWHDYLLMNVISSPDKIGQRDPLSAGMLKETVENTIVLSFNNLREVEEVISRERDQIAALILEPIPHNIGCVLPKQEFLEGLRKLTTENGIILVFDEVITCFRHSLGGYQEICGVTPDLTCLGKAIANGYPLAAICGRKDLMERFRTAGGDVFFAGTYNAHPLATAAGLATVGELESGDAYEHIFRLGGEARQGLQQIIDTRGIEAHVAGFGSVFVVYFMSPPVENYTDLLRNNAELDLAFRKGMIERGVFFLPTPLKRCHISTAHTREDIRRTLEEAEDVLTELGKR
jgi:glutamate-1-semialdehyde 2,1-aminomutase